MSLPRYRSTLSSSALFLLCAALPGWIAACAVLLHALGVSASWSPASEPLPRYELSLQGQPEESSVRLHRDSTLRIRLIPAVRTAAPVTLRAFVSQPLSMQRWPVAFEPLDGGGFLLQAPVRELPILHAGRWDLTLIIQKPQLWHRFFTPGAACADDDRPSCVSFLVHLELTAD